MSGKPLVTNRPTGESLSAVDGDDYNNIPGATPFFKLDSKEFSLENFVPSEGLPSNPQDYLRNVMFEARRCPDVVVAKSMPSKIKHNNLNLPKQEEIPGRQFAPSEEWCKMQVSNFSVARTEYSRHVALLKSIKRQTKKRPKLPIYPLPAWDDEVNWRHISLGNKLPETCEKGLPKRVESNDQNDDPVQMCADADGIEATNCSEVTADPSDPCTSSAADEDRVIDLSQLQEGYPPLMRVILRMDAKHVEANLEYHVRWLEAHGFSHQQGRWIYALLVCLEKPLFPTVISTLRDLARQCARLRTSYTSDDDRELNGLNLIMCIVGKYFDQSDLLDAV